MTVITQNAANTESGSIKANGEYSQTITAIGASGFIQQTQQRNY